MSNEQGILERSETLDTELYDDLLNRYERVLVFAGQLQEKLREQRRLAEGNQDLEEEKAKLEKLVAADEAYIRLLENALRALDIFPEEKLKAGPDQTVESSEPGS